MEFLRFDTEPDFDKVQIYFVEKPYPLIGDYSGKALPGHIVSDGSLIIFFTTDNAITKTGFEMKYTVFESGSGKCYL